MSIALILAWVVVKFTVWDPCLYTVHHLRPSTKDPAGDTIFDPTLGLLPRWACAALYTVCYGMLLYTSVDMYYHIASLVGRLILRQPAWQWPPPSRHPRTARGCPRRLWFPGDPADTNSSGTCSSSSACGPVTHCSVALGLYSAHSACPRLYMTSGYGGSGGVLSSAPSAASSSS